MGLDEKQPIIEFIVGAEFKDQPQEVQARLITAWRIGFSACADYMLELKNKYPDKEIDPKTLFTLWMREGRGQGDY